MSLIASTTIYVYFDPDNGDRAVFIPWGADEALDESDRGKVTSELSRRMSRIPALRERYLDTVQWVLDEVWDEQLLQELIDRFEAQVKTAEAGPSYRKASADGLRDWVAGRRGVLEDFIAQGGETGGDETGPCTGATDPRDFLLAAELATTAGSACATVRPNAFGALVAVLFYVRRRGRRA